MTTTQHDGFHATTCIKSDGTPQYVPPALQGHIRTYRESQQPHLHHSKAQRDLPPHRDPQQSPLRRSDLPNWRAPSPNHPTSCQSPSPLLQSPPNPPISPLFTNIPSMPPRNHTGSQLISDLVSLINTTLDSVATVMTDVFQNN